MTVADAEEVAGDGHPEEVDLVAAELAVDVEEDGKTRTRIADPIVPLLMKERTKMDSSMMTSQRLRFWRLGSKRKQCLPSRFQIKTIRLLKRRSNLDPTRIRCPPPLF
jgi:hypothetical protein